MLLLFSAWFMATHDCVAFKLISINPMFSGLTDCIIELFCCWLVSIFGDNVEFVVYP